MDLYLLYVCLSLYYEKDFSENSAFLKGLAIEALFAIVSY